MTMGDRGPTQQFISVTALVDLLTAAMGQTVETGEVGTPVPVGSNILDGRGKSWPADVFRSLMVEIYEGLGSHQAKIISSNSRNSLVIAGTWEKAIGAGARFRIKAPCDLRQALRDVLGGGNDISAANPLEVHDPKVGSLISYEGTTTANGAGDGSTLICAGLAAQAEYDGNLVIVTSGAYAGQARDINGITVGGTVTPDLPFGGQIVSGTRFVIIGIRTVTAEVAALQADVGDASASAMGSLYGILGNPAQSFLAMIGYEGATALADKLTAARAALIDELSDIRGSMGIFYEQADVPVNINAVNTGETDVLHLSAASTRYIVRSLRLKCADPGANTVTVRLYELVNDILTEVDSFPITNANFSAYHSLMDMFGLPHLAGDELRVTVRASAGGPYAVTGQYSHAKTNN